jgi:hypothetical protein
VKLVKRPPTELIPPCAALFCNSASYDSPQHRLRSAQPLAAQARLRVVRNEKDQDLKGLGGSRALSKSRNMQSFFAASEAGPSKTRL